MKIEFEVPGKPFGKERPRFTRYGSPYTASKTVDHEKAVALVYKSKYGRTKFPPDAALGVDIKAYMPIPKRTPKYKLSDMISGRVRPTVRPDWDNIGKLICEARVQKFYGETPKTVITVYTVE